MKTRCHAASSRPFGFSILATALALATVSCGSYNSGGGGGNAPYISNLSPGSGPVGTSVTISGNYFGASQGSSTVTFNGTAATPTSWSNTSILVPVPMGVPNGSVVVVVTVAGVASNSMTFTVVNNASAPAITSLTPNSGAAGISVTIAGTNFGASQGTSSTVTFYINKTAAVTTWSATSIVVTVPSGATTGAVVVTVGGVASNGMMFTVTGSTAIAFPIKLSTSKRYLVDANGNPWLMVADAGHHIMAGLPQSSVATYLNDRKNNGFNTINLYGACGESGTSATSGVCQASGVAYDGTPPFTVGSSSTDYDLSKPNLAYWTEVDNVINQANNLGLVVLFDPLPWSVNFGSAMENVASPVNYPANDYAFGQFLGNRYKSFPNIIWQFGQDFRHGGTPVGSSWLPVDSTFMDYMAQLIAGVASVDTTHLITSQMNYNASYTQQGLQVACNANCINGITWNPRFGNNNNVSFVYTYYETYDEMLQAYNCGPTGPCTMQPNNGTVSTGGSAGNTPSSQFPPSVMPTILGESNYETANNTGMLSPPSANAFVTRLEMWYAMTSGGAGFEFGNEHVNHFDTSWQSNLDTTATLQVNYVASLLSQFNWWTFVPDATNQVVTAASAGAPNPTNGNLYNATHATTTWDGSSNAIIYTPVTAMLTINMSRFSGPVTARWYDPTKGNFTATPCTSATPCANSGTKTFTTPAGPHSDGTNANDWVLVLQ